MCCCFKSGPHKLTLALYAYEVSLSLSLSLSKMLHYHGSLSIPGYMCVCVCLSLSLSVYIYIYSRSWQWFMFVSSLLFACHRDIPKISPCLYHHTRSTTGTARKYNVSNFLTTLISNCLFLGIIPSGSALKAIHCSQPAGLQSGRKSRAICCVGPPSTGTILIWDWGIYQCTCNGTEIQGLNLPRPLFPGNGVFCPIVNPRKCATGFGNPHVFTPGGIL